MKCICPSGGDRTCPDDCRVAVWHSLPPSERRAQRKSFAEDFFKQGYTMERIAIELGVSKGQISIDLKGFNCLEIKQSKPSKTASNPRGAGRPKGSKNKPRKPRPKLPPPKPLPDYTPPLDPALADQPDPAFPGHTYAQSHGRKYGYVNVIPIELRDLQNKQMKARDFSNAARDFGQAAKVFLKVTSFTPDEYSQILATMENGGLKWRNRLMEHINEIMTAFYLLKPFDQPFIHPKIDAAE